MPDDSDEIYKIEINKRKRLLGKLLIFIPVIGLICLLALLFLIIPFIFVRQNNPDMVALNVINLAIGVILLVWIVITIICVPIGIVLIRKTKKLNQNN